MKVLLHACCGPCASACIPALRALGHEPVLLFSNSNIAPDGEFEKRLAALRILAQAERTALLVDPPDHGAWLGNVARGLENEPEKGLRCAKCFRWNLSRTAEIAKAENIPAFTTSLTVSPHKISKMVFEAGAEVSPEKFLPVDFKKNDGFKKSLARSKELGLYRQNWCGCEFSRRKTDDDLVGTEGLEPPRLRTGT